MMARDFLVTRRCRADEDEWEVVSDGVSSVSSCLNQLSGLGEGSSGYLFEMSCLMTWMWSLMALSCCCPM